MSHTPHELADDFPEYADAITELKSKDAHFSRLMDEYHDVNRAVHRAETKLEPIDDLAEDELRKTRMALKDELYKMLRAAAEA
ncbi:YdcH family protein [Aliiroseovarius sp. PTFE2010]|uniref:YdcH family protein n=1 Tax=Aliiroseovarius sp. PTFE2010 TaxID=3417190 RepID=UPI003CEC4D6F